MSQVGAGVPNPASGADTDTRGGSETPEVREAKGRVNQVVLAVTALGAISSLATVFIAKAWENSRGEEFGQIPFWLPLLFIGLGVISELVYVPIRRGDSIEELTFVEVVVAASLLALPPSYALIPPILGLAAVHISMRRPLKKTAFNLGSVALAASAMTLVYLLLGGHPHTFGLVEVLALLAATLVFTMVNLLAMATILKEAEGHSFSETLSEEWRLSTLMALSCAGIALVGVSIAETNPVLLPFTTLPIVSLWYAYRAAAQHANGRVRTEHLLRLGDALAGLSAGQERLADATESIRQIFDVDHVLVFDGSHDQMLEGASDLTWVPMDLGSEANGALVVGNSADRKVSRLPWAHGSRWNKDSGDENLLRSLAAAMASAIRSGRAIQALAAETAKLSAVVDHASDGIAVLADSDVLLWSPAMSLITGINEKQASGEEKPAFVHELARELAMADGDDPHTFNLQLERAGDVRELQVAAERAQHSGQGVWVLTVRDLTRERRVERLKSDFVATISHELRTPITPLRGYATLLASRGDKMDPARRQAALEMMAERAEHLSRLVDDLLLASRVSDGSKLAVEVADVPLADVITQAAGNFPNLSGRLQIEIPDVEPIVRCDRVRAVQCLSNLLGNAEKYVPGDSPVVVTSRVSEGRVHIDVIDQGPGIAAAERDRIFDRFYRIEDPMTMRTGGAGLGLHIARELAVAMNGAITVTSEPGAGSTFTLSLPLAVESSSGETTLKSAPLD